LARVLSDISEPTKVKRFIEAVSEKFPYPAVLAYRRALLTDTSLNVITVS
jgi:hypothetical protein